MNGEEGKPQAHSISAPVDRPPFSDSPAVVNERTIAESRIETENATPGGKPALRKVSAAHNAHPRALCHQVDSLFSLFSYLLSLPLQPLTIVLRPRPRSLAPLLSDP